jgi:ribA/ribD-fused uncharacterized protein
MNLPKIIDSFSGEWGFLSNFSPNCPVIKLDFEPFIIEGDTYEYKQSEIAYHAAKTLLLKERERFQLDITPNQSKKMGRGVTLRTDWEVPLEEGQEPAKILAMRGILKQKFTPTILRRKLFATFTAELIEGNYWHDVYWGVCTGSSCKQAPHEPFGENHLGKILMELRTSL